MWSESAAFLKHRCASAALFKSLYCLAEPSRVACQMCFLYQNAKTNPLLGIAEKWP